MLLFTPFYEEEQAENKITLLYMYVMNTHTFLMPDTVADTAKVRTSPRCMGAA